MIPEIIIGFLLPQGRAHCGGRCLLVGLPAWRTEGGPKSMRGYFGVGGNGISKPMNLGNLVCIAHAFDASFFFSIAPRLKLSDAQSDTSRAQGTLPFYSFAKPEDLRLPIGSRLVGGGI